MKRAGVAMFGLVLCVAMFFVCGTAFAGIASYGVTTSVNFVNDTGVPYTEVGVSKIVEKITEANIIEKTSTTIMQYDIDGKVSEYSQNIVVYDISNGNVVPVAKSQTTHMDNMEWRYNYHFSVRRWVVHSRIITNYAGNSKTVYEYSLNARGRWILVSQTVITSFDGSDLPWGLGQLVSTPSSYDLNAWFSPRIMSREVENADIDLLVQINELQNGAPVNARPFLQSIETSFRVQKISDTITTSTMVF